MGDYANDIRRGEQKGHIQYPKKVDGIIRQNARHLVSAVGDDTFQLDELDGVVLVNVDAADATVYLPSLNSCEPDQEIRVCAVGIPGRTVNVSVLPGSGDLINEAALPPIPIQVPFGYRSSSRKFQRCLSNAFDSWYLVCCLEEQER